MLENSHTFSGFSVNNLAVAADFYSNTLGLEVADTGMGLEVKVRDGRPVFLYEKQDHVSATFTVLNFVVNDINETIDGLVAKGVVFERYEGMPAEQDERGVLRGKAAGQGPDIAWFKDPAGNILSVLSE